MSSMSSMSSGEERNEGERTALCFPWLYGLFVRTLISRANAYASCGRPTLNVIERFELGPLRSNTAMPVVGSSCWGLLQHRMYTDYVAGLARL